LCVIDLSIKGFNHVKSKRIIEVANIILTKYHG